MVSMTSLILLTLAVADPVSGSPLYTPSIGEVAIIHGYDPAAGEVMPVTQAWVNPAALINCLGIQLNAKEGHDPADELQAMMRKSILDGNAVLLRDMTLVRVRALATFWHTKGLSDNNVVSFPDHYLVEVITGEHKGRLLWVIRPWVRVPGSKAPGSGR